MKRERWFCPECQQGFPVDDHEANNPSGLCDRCEAGDTPANYIKNHCLPKG